MGFGMNIDPIAATSSAAPEHSATDDARQHEPRSKSVHPHPPRKPDSPPETPNVDEGAHVNRMA
jgi:hypothetical protein